MNISRDIKLPALALVLSSILVGCASSPGAPVLRMNSDDGHGVLLPECQNVSPLTPPLSYQTKFYLSTWSSAWFEGVQSGVRSGLRIEPEDRSRVRFTKQVSVSVVARSFGFDGSYPYPPFCQLFRAPEERVKSAVRSIIPKLQNPIQREEEAIGVFATDYLRREHAAAKWRDRYIIQLRELTNGDTAVYVYRDLWISRQGAPEVRAASNGGNEAWILQNIAKALR